MDQDALPTLGYSYSAPLTHWTFKDANKVLPNTLVMAISLLQQKKTRTHILLRGV